MNLPCQPPIEELVPRFGPPDLYQLTGREVHITYHTADAGGLPTLIYQDRHRTLQFRGDEIRRLEAPDLGILVSVTLVLSVDSGSTTLTLVLPHVNLPEGAGASGSVSCVAITTFHRSSSVPVFEEGQRECYSGSRLSGPASRVVRQLAEEGRGGPPPGH